MQVEVENNAVKRSIDNSAEADGQSPKKIKLEANEELPKKIQLGAEEPPTTSDAVAEPIVKKKKKKNLKSENGKKIKKAKTGKKKSSENNENGEKKLEGTPEEIIEKRKEKLLAKKAKLLEKKKKQLIEKNLKRKLKRLESGQFKPEQIKKSKEEIEERIVAIKSRPKLTKTARRRLAVLQKKLSILDGSYVAKSLETTPTLTPTEKRKLRKLKMNLKKKAEAGEKVEGEAEAGEKVEGTGEGSSEGSAEKPLKVKKQKSPEKKKNKLTKKEKKQKAEQKVKSEGGNEGIKEEKPDASSTDVTVKQEGENNEETAEKTAKAEKEKPTEKKTRFVLFVGNIADEVTQEDVKNHFLTRCSAVKSVRLPLKPDNTPKGICFVELDNSVDYEKALGLHLSILNGKKINVEYSASGSKKEKIKGKNIQKKKNLKLHSMKKTGKLAGSSNDSQKRKARRNKNKPE